MLTLQLITIKHFVEITSTKYKKAPERVFFCGKNHASLCSTTRFVQVTGKLEKLYFSKSVVLKKRYEIFSASYPQTLMALDF